MTLYEFATVVRSKNAGPFTLTVDLIFASEADMDRALRAPGFDRPSIALLYGVPEEAVAIHEFRPARAVKVSLPRLVSSGAVGDRDVYGSQQHMLLGRIRIPARSPDRASGTGRGLRAGETHQ